MPIPRKKTAIPKWVDDNLPPELATSTLFQFKVKLQATEVDAAGKAVRKEVEVNLLPDLDIDMATIEEQMMDLPATYAFWSTVSSEVRLGVAIAERKLKARRAEATQLVLDRFRQEGQKPPSLETLKTLVEADERLNAAELNYQLAQMQSGKLYHMLEALKMKAEMSRSLLALKKHEFGQ
jgi:hypothetical protein